MEPEIIFEDEQMMVVDKPAGMVVNRAQTVSEETVQDWLERSFQFPVSSFQNLRSGIVHRLDKDTSGLLVIAKNPEVFEKLQQQFKKREVQKTYIALVYGQLKPREGTIAVPVGRSSNPKKFVVRVGGKPAQTTYVVERYLKDEQGNDYTQVRLSPRTGRTHQLRVHLSYLGHPIVADSRYGGEKRVVKDKRWCPRQFLHAFRLELVHPVGGQKLRFQADLPVDLARALRRLS